MPLVWPNGIGTTSSGLTLTSKDYKHLIYLTITNNGANQIEITAEDASVDPQGINWLQVESNLGNKTVGDGDGAALEEAKITFDYGENTTFTINSLLWHKVGMNGNRMVTGISIPVTLTCPTVPSIELNKTTLSLEEGATETLTATVKNVESPTITWASSNNDVATVDNNGKVTAMAVGSAEITATVTVAGDDFPEDYTATCAVTVTEPAVLTPATYYGAEEFNSDILAQWSVTRNANKTLTFAIEYNAIPVGLVNEVYINGALAGSLNLTGNVATYTTTETYTDGDKLAAAYLRIASTVDGVNIYLDNFLSLYTFIIRYGNNNIFGRHIL